jgi:hypothetical protein
VSVAGSGDIRVDRVQGEAFEASVAGSGDIELAQLQSLGNFSVARIGQHQG